MEARSWRDEIADERARNEEQNPQRGFCDERRASEEEVIGIQKEMKSPTSERGGSKTTEICCRVFFVVNILSNICI